MCDNEGQNVIVTGGTSGIGKAIVFNLVQSGASVVFCGRDDSKGDAIYSELMDKKGTSKYIHCDVTQRESVSEFFDEAEKHLGTIDVAVNNAGIEGEIIKFHESTEENWDSVIQTNLKGVWFCMKKEIATMLAQGKGNIINISSTSGVVGNGFGFTAYAASKHAIIGLTKSVALEYAKENIRVNAVCPGFIATPMIDNICQDSPKMRRRFAATQPIGRMGSPDEIADAVAYLSSDNSRFMTGHALIIDGGLTI